MGENEHEKIFCLRTAGFAAGRRAAFAKKSYVNGIDPNYPPFAYMDEKTGQAARF